MLVCLYKRYQKDSQDRQRERHKLTNSEADSTNVQEGAD